MECDVLPNAKNEMPEWVPEAARNYLIHTETGQSIRELARGAGCHASTVMRQVRRTETRRDDPLIDEALTQLGAQFSANPKPQTAKEYPHMNMQVAVTAATPDEAMIETEARRILRRLCEPSACLAVAKDMEKAVVVREGADGKSTRTGVVDRQIAQAMALKEWIKCKKPGRISRYNITSSGRAALKRFLAEDQANRLAANDLHSPYADQHRDMSTKDFPNIGGGINRARYNMSESPVSAMSRRKDKDGKPFLSSELVDAAERLREGFELAQMGPRVAQNWDAFLTGGNKTNRGDGGTSGGPSAARARVAAALKDLGPGLGDVVLRVCCFLEGMEMAEKRMGWSARSGKIVLRIALQRLKRHYSENNQGQMIG